MLRMLDRSEVPTMRCAERSEVRRFAADTLREFLDVAQAGDVAEVTGAPEAGGDAVRQAERVMSAIRTEAFYMDARTLVRAFRRRERMFLERVEPPEPKGMPLYTRKEGR